MAHLCHDLHHHQVLVDLGGHKAEVRRELVLVGRDLPVAGPPQRRAAFGGGGANASLLPLRFLSFSFPIDPTQEGKNAQLAMVRLQTTTTSFKPPSY